MKIFLLLLLASVCTANFAGKRCLYLAHVYLQDCGNNADAMICVSRIGELELTGCNAVLEDVRICTADFQRTCSRPSIAPAPRLAPSLPPAPRPDGPNPTVPIPQPFEINAKPFDMKEEVHETMRCIGEHVSEFSAACQATSAMTIFAQRFARKRCSREAGMYLRQCGLNEALPECAAMRAKVHDSGCDDTLVDMQLCHPDMIRLCKLADNKGVPIPVQSPSGGSTGQGQTSSPQFPAVTETNTQDPSGNGLIRPIPFRGQCRMIRDCLLSHLDELSMPCRQSKLIDRMQQDVKEDGDQQLNSDDETEKSPRGWKKICQRFAEHRRHYCHRHFLPHACIIAILVTISLIYLICQRRRRAALRQERFGESQPKTGTWTTGLFGSWHTIAPDWKTCIPSFFLPHAQTALNQAELLNRDVTVADVCMNVYNPMLVTNVFRDRQELRLRYDIPEAACQDMLASAFCTPCAIAQHAREIDVRAGIVQGSGFAYQGEEMSKVQPEVVIKVQP